MSAKGVTSKVLLKLFLIISIGHSLGSCGPLLKEGQDWLNVSLNISTTFSQRISRTGTENRLTEYVLAVDKSIPFSANGPSIDQVQDSNLVTLTNNTTTLSLPVGKQIKLLIFRYGESLTISQLDELMALQQLGEGSTELGIAPAIDFGQSEAFEINESEETMTIPVRLAPDITGKLAQTYVRGATVWADRLEVGSNTGNFLQDEGEVSTFSEADGSYFFSEPPAYDHLIVTEGGTKLNASGLPIPAAPMLAPSSDFGQETTNITPLTTLVATQPSLADHLASLGDWNIDVASSAGVPGSLLKLSLTTETFWSVLGSGTSPVVGSSIVGQLNALGKLAEAFAVEVDTGSFGNLSNVVAVGIENVLNDSTISRALNEKEKVQLKTALSEAVSEISSLSDDVLVEGDILSDIENTKVSVFGQISNIVCGDTSDYLNFTPAIKSITMIHANGSLHLVGVVDDDDYTQLSFNWFSEGGELVSFSSSCGVIEAIYEGFSPIETHSFSFQVSEPGTEPITKTCTWAIGADITVCEF